jgi:hypothetical protein
MAPFVKLLHVISMATWLAAALWLAGDARRSLAAGPDAARAFVGRAMRSLGLERVAGALTIVTGLALLHFAGVWPNVRAGLWLGMAMAVLRAALTDAAMFPTVRRIQARLATGADPVALEPLAAKLATFSKAGHLLWLLALSGMVLPL